METAQLSLTDLVEKTRERVAAQKEALSAEELASRAHALMAEELAENATRDIVDREGNAILTHPFYGSISRPGVVSVAEIVRGKTSEETVPSPAFLDVAIDCAAAGVAALSYVVEPLAFGGSDEEFFEIADTVSVPVLHKDIIIDQYQVDLAFAQGAQAITLIARILSDEALKQLSTRAQELGMDVVVAVQSEEDLAKALGSNASIVSINDVLLCEEPLSADEVVALRKVLPEEVLVLVSGIRTIDDVSPLVELDVKGVFLDDMLMRADDRRLMVQAFDEVVNEALMAQLPQSDVAFGPGMPGAVPPFEEAIGPDGSPLAPGPGFEPEFEPGQPA